MLCAGSNGQKNTAIVFRANKHHGIYLCRRVHPLRLPSSPEASGPPTVRPVLDLAKKLIDFILHIDVHLAQITADYGLWTYGILALIVFCETGLVVTPFLPGDSLLFAAGAIAAIESAGLNVHLLAVVLFVCAVLGDSVNYWIGSRVGPGVFKREDSWLLRKKHLERTHAFFEKHGGKTIVLARFVPIVRTFAPFVAGVGSMTYRTFILYNIIGALAWVGSFLYLGYFFGNMPVVKKNFSIVILAIIVISVIPVALEFFKAYRESRAAKT